MQVNRLFEIIYILLNKENVTAKELSEQFEVSSRTIYRDIEVLCQSGIPIYTTQGKGGGIRLLDNFVLDKSVLSQKEQEEIISALQGLSATNYPDVDQVLSKLNKLFGTDHNSWIEVDFSNWGSTQKEKFNLMKQAVIKRQVVSFEYYNTYHEKTIRDVEPLKLWFKDKTWYIKAYCRLKSDVRIFKLNRIRNIVLRDEFFKPRLIDEQKFSSYKVSYTNLIIKIHSSQAYRVYDEFVEEQIEKVNEDYFMVNVGYPEDEWVYGYLLSFGCYAEVIEPLHIREIMKEKLQKTLDLYK
jgi:predicted DNA-binding transcriptional regulator YafY